MKLSIKSDDILRPRTAYNFFYKHHRKVLLKEIKGQTTKHEEKRNDLSNKGGNDELNKESEAPNEESKSWKRWNCEAAKEEEPFSTHPGLRRRRHEKMHGLIGFQELTLAISNRWKKAKLEERAKFNDMANQDKMRYYEEKLKRIEAIKKVRKIDEKIQKDTCISDHSLNSMSQTRRTMDESEQEVGKMYKFHLEKTKGKFLDEYFKPNYTDKFGLKWSKGEILVLMNLFS